MGQLASGDSGQAVEAEAVERSGGALKYGLGALLPMAVWLHDFDWLDYVQADFGGESYEIQISTMDIQRVDGGEVPEQARALIEQRVRKLVEEVNAGW